jgi:tRNA G18 (ribose-2'-O)-methylase SpoU
MPRHTNFKQVETRYNKEVKRNVLARPGVHEFIVVLDQLKASFNVPKILRCAEVFGACEIQLINIGVFDPAPAKGALRKIPARFPAAFDDCYKDLAARGYTQYLLVPEGDLSLANINFDQKSAFIFGHEEFGPSFNPDDFPEIRTVSIPQFGETESLNVSNAAAIVMFEYVRQIDPPQSSSRKDSATDQG